MRNRGNPCPLIFDLKDEKSRSMTRQSFAKDADINNIMSRYAVSGVLVDPSNVDSARVPRFGDFSDIGDYSHVVGRIQQAQSDFMTLSADVRARFGNDVENCLEFIADPMNVREAVSLGLLPETMIAATQAVLPEVVAPALPEPTPVIPAS